jgi:hypothetical protein
MQSVTDRFAELANAFCFWAEGEPGDAIEEAEAARRFLADLYSVALGLPYSPADADSPSGEAWEKVYRRFGALPFNYYSTVDPHQVPAENPMVDDLADDLADIWSDLKTGLQLHQSGQVEEAAGHWGWAFRAHWGAHAANALHALHAWVVGHSQN